MLEIHDEVAAQIQNCQEDFEYIDGVSSVADDEDEFPDSKSRLSSLVEDQVVGQDHHFAMGRQ